MFISAVVTFSLPVMLRRLSKTTLMKLILKWLDEILTRFFRL